MEPILTIVGTGPGDPRYLTPAAREAITDAQVLVGGRRLLDSFATPDQECVVIDKNLSAVVEYIQSQLGHRRVVVLVSGDTGIYSMAAYLRRQMAKTQMVFIPGISSVQFMFARLQRPWQNVPIFSMHGRAVENLPGLVTASPVCAILTGGDWTPQTIAQYLYRNGVKAARAAIGKNLSYTDERIIQTTLEELLDNPDDYSDSVMVIYHEE